MDVLYAVTGKSAVIGRKLEYRNECLFKLENVIKDFDLKGTGSPESPFNMTHSSRPEVASVRPLGTADPSTCSRTAVVTSVSSVPARGTTIVTAEESVTGQELRCDVIVDKITQMHIETTTKELFLDDSPEEFIIRARNDKNDVFSSLDGMLFDWSLVSDGDQNAANVLRLLKFSESSYTALPHIKQLEEQGKRGDRILMKGLQTGGAIVSVKPVDPAYQHLPGHEVRVLVVANLQLSPPVVYILPHLTVSYKVELLKQGKAHEVKMPSKQYHLELANKIVATLDSKTSTVTGIEFGSTEIKLKDQTLQPSDTLREPSAVIYIVSPAYLEFTVDPDPNWLLETSRRYVVHVNVFDGGNHKIYPSNNLRVAATFPDRHFRVISATANGTYYVVETLSKGFVNLYAQLKSVTAASGEEFTFEKPVEGTQAVEIFEPIVLLPETVILPWEPSGNKIQFQFNVSGGSGNYSWHSNNPGVAEVQPSGLVTVRSTIGSVTVKALDIRNAAHFDSSQLHVVPPSRLVFLPSKVETEIGSFVKLPIALYGQLDNREVSFDDCHSIELSVLLSDSNIFRVKSIKESSTAQACADLLLEATGVGHIEATVAYENGRIKLKASQVVAAYTPLIPFHPKEVAVVTLGSSLDVIFEGGPRPWVIDASGFFQIASFEKEKLVAAGKPRISDVSKHRHLVGVRCLNFGEQQMTLTVGNKPTAKNPFPATSVATVTYACETPKGLHLFPLIEHPANLPPCPISAEFDDPVPVPLQTDVQMVAILTDGLGRRFGNFSSLVVDWQVSDSNLGKFSSRLPTGMERKKPVSGHLGYKWISLSSVVGLLTVTVQIEKYDPQFVDSWFSNKAVSPPIAKSRILQLVAYPNFSDSQVILFNHVDVKASIDVIGGSGHYKVDQNERTSKIAKITYSKENTHNITVVPIVEGAVVLSVADLCLSPMQSSTVTIFVSDINRIVLKVVDKVELHNEVELSVKVLDGNGLPIDSSFFSLMKVQPISRSDIISVRQSLSSPTVDRLTAMYIVRGESLGRAFLQVSAVSKMGHTIMSQAKEIQVFPPLHLKPKNITIIPGTFFQVMAFGGPQPESTIEFTIVNQTVASVTNEGLITALVLGSTRVVAMATGQDASNSSRVVFSQDFAVLDVVELTEVRIVTPLKRIQAGTQMPVYAVGLNENVTPFSFANVDPPLKFRWMIANDQVAQLRPVYHKSGIDMSDEGNFAVRFLALSSGHVALNLVVTSQHSKVDIMKDSVVIQVFDHLSFLSPPISDGVILMMPGTEMFVKTNRDGSAAQLSYVVVDPDCSDPPRPPVVSVSRSGLLSSASYPGQAHLRVTAQEEFGVNHTMVILVKVKPLSYIMINTDTLIRTRVPGISSFPIGTTINFVVSLHDDVGEQFHATQFNIGFHLNKYDQIQILYGKTNNSLAARANSPGLTVLEVYEKSNPLIVDYIGIPVDSAIHPSRAQVALGSIICFSSHLLTGEGHMGEWVSSGDIIAIDRTSGVAFANRIGSSYITYNVSYVATQTNLKVLPLTKVSLKAASPLLFLTNVVTEKVHSTPSVQVIVENYELSSVAGFQGTNCSELIRALGPASVDASFFSCDIRFSAMHDQFDVDDIVHVTPAFDAATGTYNCHVTVSVTQTLLPVIASFESAVKLYAKISAQEGQGELSSKALVLPFHPAFFIQNPELLLSVNQATVNMRVVATEHVFRELQVISSDESLVRVRSPHSRGLPSDSALRYFPVDLQLTSHMWNAASSVVNLTVKCVLTGQSQVVGVGILRSDQAEMSWGHLLSALLHKYSNFFFFIICLVATVSCIIIAYHLVYGQRYHYPGTGSAVASAAFLSSSNGSSSPFAPAYPSQTPPSSTSPPRMWTADRSPYSTGLGQRVPRQTSGLDRSF